MTAKPKRIILGKIATAHGVRGLVKLLVFAEDPRSLEQYGSLYTSSDGGNVLTLKLKNSLGSKGTKFWLAEVEGIADRTEAEKLRGTELWLDRDKLPAIAKNNQFYIEDLIGLNVRDKSGDTLGMVAAVRNFGAGDLLEIQPVLGESFYLPFTKENVPAVDIKGGAVTVHLPDGLV
jgi:16S rRNA processing protein RimM